MRKNDQEYLNNLRHSSAHLLATAVLKLWPKAKPAIGPSIENGFYYDFDFQRTKNKEQRTSINEKDLTKIQEKMGELVKKWDSFESREVTIDEAKELFKDNPYKLELIDEFVQRGEKITVYKSGDFLDLCRGGHIKNPQKELKHFKLLSIAGAYWRGDEKREMLTRIYGTCWPTKKELENYLWQLEETKKRDHRKIGEDLELFTVSHEVGQGLILWLPKGEIVKEELENWVKKTEREWGYLRVTTPHITKSNLYYTSGHLPYYKSDMYPAMKLDKNEEYYLKPMNCPHHHMIYKSKPRSYKDLPLRLAEYGTCYRYEASGQLFGLMRVRGFTQNDSHIYCSLKQAVDEFVAVMKLHQYYYEKLGIRKYHLELGLPDSKKKNKYHGNKKMWESAEKLMRKAVEKTNIKMVEARGDAAFYGPKIDFIIHSSIGREFAISTNQIDLFMGPRFNLKYIDKDGSKKTPVIIHRAPLGSHERFIGFLIEHFAGAFPVWLAPVQVRVLPVSKKQKKYAEQVIANLKKEIPEIRIEFDAFNETLGNKIRKAQLEKIPYMLVVGDKELKSQSFSIRRRDGKDLGKMKAADFLKIVKREIQEKKSF